MAQALQVSDEPIEFREFPLDYNNVARSRKEGDPVFQHLFFEGVLQANLSPIAKQEGRTFVYPRGNLRSEQVGSGRGLIDAAYLPRPAAGHGI